MILVDVLDKDGKPIDDSKKYWDVVNNVDSISIITHDGIWYAQPVGLDAEKLEDVHEFLAEQ